MEFEVGLHVENVGKVASTGLGDALRAVRKVKVEAPTQEAAEFYAQQLMETLIMGANLMEQGMRQGPGRR
jgi:hypothetical protein